MNNIIGYGRAWKYALGDQERIWTAVRAMAADTHGWWRRKIAIGLVAVGIITMLCRRWQGLRVLARTADAGEDCECWRALQVLASTAGAEKTCGGLKMRRETLFYWLEPPLMGNMYGLAQTGELYPSKSKSLEPWCSTVRAKYERSSVQRPARMSFLAIGYSLACLGVFCELVKIENNPMLLLLARGTCCLKGKL
jgi:hypothetical protein